MKTGVIGRRLTMKGELVDLVLRGLKNTTIRLGRLKPKHRVVVLHGGGRDVAKIEITGVKYRRLGDLTDEDAKRDGFESLEDLLKALRKMYGKISLEEPVTILEFKVVKLLEPEPKPKVSAVRLAKAMLESGAELSMEERRVLSEVVKRGSIRKAAVALYGDVNRRWLVRRVLRKALRSLALKELLEEGGGRGEG